MSTTTPPSSSLPPASPIPPTSSAPPSPPVSPAAPPTLSDKIDQAVNDSLDLLTRTLQFTHQSATKHELLMVTGWNQSPDVHRAIAHYFVGLCVMSVNSVLSVRADLLDTPSGIAEVRQNVEDIIGRNGKGLTKSQIVKYRNPWLAEALWHLCLAVSMRSSTPHPPGILFALSQPHADANEHGVDIGALYEEPNGIGLFIVETKAYKKSPSGAIRDAAKFFRKINAGEYRKKIRELILQIRKDLPASQQAKITAQLWEERRWYVPNPHYDEVTIEDWMKKRPVLERLLKSGISRNFKPPQGVLIMPNAIADFDTFFEKLAAEMMIFVNGL